MKIIFLPLTLIIMFVLGIVLILTAFTATLVSMLASSAAYLIIRLVVWQESEFLVKLTTIFGTDKTKQETK